MLSLLKFLYERTQSDGNKRKFTDLSYYFFVHIHKSAKHKISIAFEVKKKYTHSDKKYAFYLNACYEL